MEEISVEKRYEVEIKIDNIRNNLIYQIKEKSFRDAYNRSLKSIAIFKRLGDKCRLIRIQEI